jgi:P-type Mg2+ transporter
MQMTAAPASHRDHPSVPSPASPIPVEAFWTRTPEALCAELCCALDGLSSGEAASRLARYGPNSDVETRPTACCGRSYAACSNRSR